MTPNYIPSYSFTDYQTANPSKPLPAPPLDNEFWNISTQINMVGELIDNIQKPDGSLNNSIVGWINLDTDVQGRITQAQTDAQNAVTIAGTANATASNALAVANGVDAKASTALAQSNAAVITANGANVKSDQAMADAAYAISVAEGAAGGTLDTDHVINLSGVAGSSTTQALNALLASEAALNAAKAPKASPTFTGVAIFANMSCTGNAGFSGSIACLALNVQGAMTFTMGGTITVPNQALNSGNGFAANTKYVDDAVAAATGGGGSPYVSGPAASTNNGVALWDGTTGKLLKDSGALAAIARTGLYADLVTVPAGVASWGTITPAANKLGFYTGPNSAGLTDFSVFAQGFVASANAAAARATLVAEKLGEVAGIGTKTANYTLAATDPGSIIEMNLAGANNLTIPPNSTVAIAVNSRIDLVQYGAGQTTFVPGAGVTIRSSGGKLKLTGQYSAASLYKRATDEWMLFGDLTL